MNDFKKDILDHKDKPNSSFKYDPSIFHADYSIYILYKRIDNITAAVFLITNDLINEELISSKLRQTALNCLEKIVSFIGSPKADVSTLQSIVAHVLELASILNISFWSGLISDMNATVLQREILKIQETLTEIISKYRSKHIIDPTIFSGVDLEIRHTQNMFPHVKDRIPHKYHSTVEIHKGQDKGHIKDKNVLDKNDVPINTSDPSSTNKNERRDAILNLLSDKVNLSIKDFALVIPRYSEKTIQRELLSLVENGLLKKQGERRWSTYSLNKEK